MLIRKLSAEFIGTFALVFGVLLSLSGKYPLPTPMIAGLTVGVMVYAIGSISGAHLNPAVTVGLAGIKKIDFKTASFYIVIQFLAAFCAQLLAGVFFDTDILTQGIIAGNTWDIGLAEAIGALMLVFAVSSVVYGKTNSAASGWVIGVSLALGAMAASVAGNGVINPAVAFGINSVSLMYLVAPILGGLLGAQVYRFISK
jgi:glycerol uptake facilitator-like aquaporin